MSPDDDIESDSSEIAGSDDSYFPTKEFYLKSGDQMAELFEGYEDCITNTLEIADKCDFRFSARKTAPGVYARKWSGALRIFKRLVL